MEIQGANPPGGMRLLKREREREVGREWKGRQGLEGRESGERGRQREYSRK